VKESGRDGGEEEIGGGERERERDRERGQRRATARREDGAAAGGGLREDAQPSRCCLFARLDYWRCLRHR